MKNSTIQNLFPTPIYQNNIGRIFNKKELEFIKNEKNYCVKNVGNVNTINNYILNKPELKNIKNFIQQCCDDYLKKIISPKNNVKLYITQSWLNYTNKDEFHHSHEHANSVVSGVFYFNCNKKNDSIKFTNPKGYEQIKPEIKNFNIWNSDTWWFSVESGELIMFPSSTKHQVDTKHGTNTRISLAFNTFYKGTIGSNSSLTELIL
jgi:uncharacterized protein (TIGR02466 family)